MNEQPCDYAANFIRSMRRWLDQRPEYLNDGKTVERLITEYKQERKALES
jgi:hypothetical protein